MKTTVRYQGGNTKSVVEVIANKAGINTETITIPLNETVHFCLIGGTVYHATTLGHGCFFQDIGVKRIVKGELVSIED